MVRSVGMCFLSQIFALHRPTNGATAIIPNATPNAICINFSFFSPRALMNPPGVEPGSWTAKNCMLQLLIPHYPPR